MNATIAISLLQTILTLIPQITSSKSVATVINALIQIIPIAVQEAQDLLGPIRNIIGLIRQAKVSSSADLRAAEALARTHNLYERWFPPVPTLDQEAVMVSFEENLITEEEFQRIFPKKTIYALTTEKKK